MTGLSFVKSHYSILESNISIDIALAQAKDFGHKYLGIVDTGNMHGTLDFIIKSSKAGIKAVIGLEINVEDENYEGKILLYANSNEGFYNLNEISSWVLAYAKSITWDYLQTKSEGISMVFHPTRSPINSLLLQDKKEDIISLIEQVKTIFKKVYIGTDISENKVTNDKLIKIGEFTKTTAILSNPTLFIDKSEYLIPEVLKSIKEQKEANLKNDVYKYNYFMTDGETSNFVERKIIENTNVFLEETFFKIEFKKTKMPVFKTPNKEEAMDYLRALCLKGLAGRMGTSEVSITYTDRLKKELDVIEQMDFSNYFLIVWDFIKFAHNNKIMVGPGRGSAAGSLVAYCLGITGVNPIKYGLLFERFLNADRVSMPDIDIDFEDTRRDEVIDYVFEKYGVDHVAFISTFQTIGAKMSIRDVGRALSMPVALIDILSKQIPNKPNITLLTAMEKSISFENEITKTAKNRQLLKLARSIEGCPRQLGTHAAGIVMSALPLSTYIPLVKSKSSKMLQTQYSMHYLEGLGLLKMDFLGLRNLSTINNVVKSIKETTGTEINIKEIPLDDKETYRILQLTATEGIFQMESQGMKEVLRGMKPETIEDIATTLALYRPGPMANIPTYIEAKEGKVNIKYIHPDLEEILQSTQGIIVYQEQIMQIATKIAGFSYSKSDILRRAMSKKDIKAMQQLEEEFISGAKNKRYSGIIAKSIYDLIYEFANYGFNKSHSISYALIGYQLAYLKAKYPVHFMAALLSSTLGNEVKTNKYLNECKKLKIKVLPPSINKSLKGFSYSSQGVIYSLVAIKNVGMVAYKEISEERKINGEYKDFVHFICRMEKMKISINTVESLIWAGALDEFNHSRQAMIKALPNMIRFAKIAGKEDSSAMFENSIVPIPAIQKVEMEVEEILENEFSVLGLYLSDHPLNKMKSMIMERRGVIRDIADLNDFDSRQRIAVLIKLDSMRKIVTKAQEEMAFLTISDNTSEVEAIVFPKQFAKIGFKLQRTNTYCLIGRVEKKERLQFIVEDARTLQEMN